MNTNKLKEKLDIKIQQEYDKFIEKLMELSPKEIIERSYEKIFKEEIISMIQGKELSKSEIIALLKVDYPLDALYQEWLKTDLSYVQMVDETFDKYINKLEKQKKRNDFER